MKGSIFVSLFLSLTLLVSVAVPFGGMARAQEPQSIVDIAVADGRFTTLVAAVTAAGLAETLATEGPLTVFAPTDDAFNKLPDGTIPGLLNDIQALKNVLLYHVVSGKVMASDVVSLESADTLLGKPVQVAVHGDGAVTINNAQVVITDIEASNGVIHVIDTVLLPPAAEEKPAMPEGEMNIVELAVADGRFTALVTAVTKAELADDLAGAGPFTVFAPTDDAFAKLPEGALDALVADFDALQNVLLYHVVPGSVTAAEVAQLEAAQTLLGRPLSIAVHSDGSVTVNNATVLITDIPATNGVIHVIDTVLLPPAAAAPADAQDIVDTAVADGRFTTLAAALGAVDLVDTLKGVGPFTVFAPTDDAFNKLPEGTVPDLLNNMPALTQILLYHVADGLLPAESVLKLENISMLNGQTAQIKLEDGKAMIQDTEIIITDVRASNGVIHVIDSVILPPQP